MEKTCERCRYMRLDINEEPCTHCFGRGGLPRFRARWWMSIWTALFSKRG